MSLSLFIKKHYVVICIVLLCLFLIGLIGVMSFQIVPSFSKNTFRFDFEEEGRELMSAYGTLVGCIVALLSSVLLVYTIFSQLNQFKKQSEQFKKQFKLQKRQFKIERESAEHSERMDKFFQFKLVDASLQSIYKYIVVNGQQIKMFLDAEKKRPFLHNSAAFEVNNQIKRLLSLDYVSTFKAFQMILSKNNTEEKWVERFTELFDSLEFYAEAIDEIKANFKSKFITKFDEKLRLFQRVRDINDIALKIKNSRNPNPHEHDSILLSASKLFLDTHTKMINEGLKNGKLEDDLGEVSKLLLKPYIEAIENSINISYDVDFEGLKFELMNLRKDIYYLGQQNLEFARILEKQYNEYFNSETSKTLKDFKILIDEIHFSLKNTNITGL